MGEAEATFGVQAEEAEGGKCGGEEVGDGLRVVGVRVVGLGQVGEEVGDGLQAQLPAGDFGRGRVVEQLDGVVQAADRCREPELLGGVGAEGRVVEDRGGEDGGVGDARLDPVGFGVASACGAFCCTEGGGDRYAAR